MTDVVECRTARPSFLLRCLIILAVAVGALLTSAASASASPIAQPTAASVSAAFAASSTPNALLADQKPMGSDTADSCAATTADTKWLPVGRWSTPASNLHSRLDADFWNDISQKIQRSGIFYLMLSSGNGLWSISADMATFAQRFCVMDKVGATIDSAAGTLWTGLTNSGTVALIVGLGVAVALATQVRRGDAQGTWKRLFRTAMILALMGVMSYGASTTTGGGTSGAPVSFGAGSPGWFASKINKVVTAVASAPAAAVASLGPDAAYGKPDPKDPLSCAWYRQNLLKNYEASIKTGSGSLSTKAVAAVPENLSSMWETSGLAAWTGIQFGTANDYGKRIYCHVLDMSGVHPGGGEAIALTGPGKAALPPNANPNASAWDDKQNGKIADTSGVAWAACMWSPSADQNSNGGWTVIGDWDDKHMSKKGQQTGGAVDPKECADWWAGTGKGDDATMGGSANTFNWEDGAGGIVAITGNAPHARNFLLNWQGFDNGTAFVLGLAFVFAALCMLVVFVGMSLAVIIGKVALVVMAALIFLVLLTSIWTPSRETKLGKYCKQYLGMSVFTFGISVVFGLISFITSIVALAGTAAFTPGSAMGALWTGFAPITAVVVLHMVFKQMNLPSPFKVSGAVAWGGAMAGAGAAAGVGISRAFSRNGAPAHHAKNIGKRLTNRNGSSTRPGGSVGPGVGRNGNKRRGAPRKNVPDAALPLAVGAGVGALAGAAAGSAGRDLMKKDGIPTVAPGTSSLPSTGDTHTAETSTGRGLSKFGSGGTAGPKNAATGSALAAAAIGGGGAASLAAAHRLRELGGERYADAGFAKRHTLGRAAGVKTAAKHRIAEMGTRTGQRVRDNWKVLSKNPIRKAAIATAAALAIPAAVPLTLGALAAVHLVRGKNRAARSTKQRTRVAQTSAREKSRNVAALEALGRVRERRAAQQGLTPGAAGAAPSLGTNVDPSADYGTAPNDGKNWAGKSPTNRRGGIRPEDGPVDPGAVQPRDERPTATATGTGTGPAAAKSGNPDGPAQAAQSDGDSDTSGGGRPSGRHGAGPEPYDPSSGWGSAPDQASSTESRHQEHPSADTAWPEIEPPASGTSPVQPKPVPPARPAQAPSTTQPAPAQPKPVPPARPAQPPSTTQPAPAQPKPVPPARPAQPPSTIRPKPAVRRPQPQTPSTQPGPQAPRLNGAGTPARPTGAPKHSAPQPRQSNQPSTNDNPRPRQR